MVKKGTIPLPTQSFTPLPVSKINWNVLLLLLQLLSTTISMFADTSPGLSWTTLNGFSDTATDLACIMSTTQMTLTVHVPESNRLISIKDWLMTMASPLLSIIQHPSLWWYFWQPYASNSYWIESESWFMKMMYIIHSEYLLLHTSHENPVFKRYRVRGSSWSLYRDAKSVGIW